MADQADDFPASVQGHNLGDDTTDHLVISVSLFRMRPGASAFPSIPLLEQDDLDVRAASNGRFLYFWAKGKLFAVSLEQIIRSARFHLCGKTSKEPAPKPKPNPEPELKLEPGPEPKLDSPVVKKVRRKVACACGETDIDVFSGVEGDAWGENGWRISGGKATCPNCLLVERRAAQATR